MVTLKKKIVFFFTLILATWQADQISTYLH